MVPERDSMPQRLRDKLLVGLTVMLISLVLFGYGRAYFTDHSYSRIAFGVAPVEAAGIPAYLEGVKLAAGAERLVSGSITAEVRNFLRDEFIGFDRILTGSSKVVSAANRAFYDALRPRSPLVPVGVETAGVLLHRKDNYLLRVSPSNSTAISIVPKAVDATERLAQSYPDVTFVIYGVTPWTMTSEAVASGYSDTSLPAWDQFEDSVGQRVGVGRLQVDDWDDYFFATDHHWKPLGAYQAYEDITKLLQQFDPGLRIKNLPFSEVVLDDVKFQGSRARMSAYSALVEPFRVLATRDYDVHAFVDGVQRDDLIAPEGYLENPPRGRFAEHYADYYGRDHGLIEYTSGLDTDDNLLIISNSFSNSMEDLLAASFGRSYSVDLRHYEREVGHPFNLEVFVREKGITHVVMIGGPIRVMQWPAALLEGRAIQ